MAVEAAKKFFDITISSAMSENFEYQGTYDIFLIMGSLEHSVDPNSVLESIAKGSKDGTLLIHEGRSFHYRTHINSLILIIIDTCSGT